MSLSTTELRLAGLSADLRHEGRIATDAAHAAGFSPESNVKLLAVSENATYFVHDPHLGTRQAIVRVHRNGYHNRDAIEAELGWIDEIKASGTINVAGALPLLSGGRVFEAEADGMTRYAVVFEFIDGRGLEDVALEPTHFSLLGSLAAGLHAHAEASTTHGPRFAWDWEHTLGAAPRWGRWEDEPGVRRRHIETIEPAIGLLRDRLARYGQATDRYGLIHSDLRLANLIERDDAITTIDFDDCGLGWFMYDFASSVSFLETDPRLGQWAAAWIEGYATRRPLARADLDMLPDMVMLRRLMLLAWLGTHAHSRENASLADGFADGTATIADRYLAGDLLTRTY